MFSHKFLSLLVLAATMLLTLATPAFATNAEAKNSVPTGVLASSDSIKTTWDTSGCWLHGSFDSVDTEMKRLRLTFQGAYDLYKYYTDLYYGNQVSSVLDKDYGGFGRLRNYLSSSTIAQCQGKDGIATLKSLKSFSYEYYANASVRAIVDGELSFLESTLAKLRTSLAFFLPSSVVRSMSDDSVTYIAYAITSTPEYRYFHNTLYGHDCSAVKALTAQGYSQDYVRYAYTYQAKLAIEEIWPDYEQRMSDYRNTTHAW